MEYYEDLENLVMDVSFECENCFAHIEAIVNVPDPNFMAEKNKDSLVEVETEIYCDKCGHEHVLIVTNTFYSANCYLQQGVGKYINCGFPYYNRNEKKELEWIIESNEHKEVLYKQIETIEKLKESIEVASILRTSLNIMMYAHIVAAIEGYLSASFIHNVLNSKKLFNRLCMTDPQIKSIKFEISELVQTENLIENHVTKYLNDVIFHRVDKIKIMFKSVIGHDFGDISWFGRAVSIRHDCVHRAGITKDRRNLDIENEEIEELITNAKKMAEDLEMSIGRLRPKVEHNASDDFSF